jgi:hypothetical protein
MPSHVWHAEDSTVRLELERLSVVVDPLDPAAGLQRLRVDAQPLPDLHPLRVELPPVEARRGPPDVDFYVRGGDLIATYAHRPERAMLAQVYWRAESQTRPRAIAAVELLVSVQTSLLDSCPKLATRSDVAAREAFQLTDPARAAFESVAPQSNRAAPAIPSGGPSCYLFRLGNAKYSYAEMVNPADAQQSRLGISSDETGLRARLAHELFAERLEKGVILRARVLGVLLDRDGDQAATARHYAAFLSEPPPLTT